MVTPYGTTLFGVVRPPEMVFFNHFRAKKRPKLKIKRYFLRFSQKFAIFHSNIRFSSFQQRSFSSLGHFESTRTKIGKFYYLGPVPPLSPNFRLCLFFMSTFITRFWRALKPICMTFFDQAMFKFPQNHCFSPLSQWAGSGNFGISTILQNSKFGRFTEVNLLPYTKQSKMTSFGEICPFFQTLELLWIEKNPLFSQISSKYQECFHSHR